MRILVAEDDTSSRLLLGASLQKLGYDVTATQDGQEACEALQREYFPVLITDWQMPRMDGLELCRYARANHPAPYPYIILLTAQSGKTSYLEGMNAGADDFITKPFDEDQLAARLRAAARVLDLYETLHRANEELEQRVRERTAELTVANAQLEASRELAEAGSRAKSEFLSRMSHELRTPLNAILGFSQLLQMDGLSDEQNDSLKAIAQAGQRLLTLVNGMLDVTHFNTKAPPIELEAADVIPLLCEAIDGAGRLAARHHVELNADLTGSGAAGAIVLADRKRLAQVLGHLLSNAIKFNHKGGTVAVRYEEAAGNRLRIDVRDSGPGIAPQHIEKLFTAFERLGADQHGIEGAGIGLALSKWLVEAMGGRITVQSTLGQGSTFSVELPRAHPGD